MNQRHVVAIAAGLNHACAVLADGLVKCWGSNYERHLVDLDEVVIPKPIPIAGLGEVTELSAGGFHTCALKIDGSVWCWGMTGGGKLGGDLADAVSGPTPVRDLSDAVSISAGGSFTCAMLRDGSVHCWGEDRFSYWLGDGVARDFSSSPVTVRLTGRASALSVGLDHSCALLDSDSVECWGDNRAGQLGDGTVSESALPVRVGGLSDPVAVAASAKSYHSCALSRDGSVACWGLESWLGDVPEESTLTPVVVPGLPRIKALFDDCAIAESDELWCWGRAGPPSPSSSRLPGVVSLPKPVVSVEQGLNFACALLEDGAVMCWGNGAYGELGDGNLSQGGPVEVVDL